MLGLTRGGVDLLESTLLTELGNLRGTGGSEVGLLGLSLSLLGLGSFLGSSQSLLSGGLSLSWLLVSLFLDEVQRSTDNWSLVLDGSSGSLLRGLLRDTLLVVSSVQDGPRNSSWVLSLLEQRSGLGGLESEDLGVTSDKQGTSTWVNLRTGEGVDFDLHCANFVSKNVGANRQIPRKWTSIYTSPWMLDRIGLFMESGTVEGNIFPEN